MVSKDGIPYDQLMRDALKGVVRKVLADVAKHGLPGEHHFYVAFKTKAEGVRIPAHIVERHPDEMTIVLQHRFWDLVVDDTEFAVTLSFNQRRERLIIPFSAVLGFVDPSVRFALQFQEPGSEREGGAGLPTARSAVTEQEETPVSAENEGEMPDDDDGGDGDNVVALDAFRKKT